MLTCPFGMSLRAQFPRFSIMRRQNFTDTVSQTRVGTFGQFGVGLTAQPIQNPNWTLFARVDWRTGSNIYGGTLTGGFRYQF